MHRTPGFSRRDILKLIGVAAALGGPSITASIVDATDSQKLKIGIIGSGHVGSALGGVWAKAGNEVMFSSRNLDNDKQLAAEVGSNARGYAAGNRRVRSGNPVRGSL
jgi:8-hydroxy-5-deazaflavin:NADPH oxidoreductase